MRLQKGKRRKDSSRPSPKDQLKKLQQEEEEYRRELEERGSTNPVAQSPVSFDTKEMRVNEEADNAAVVPEQITNRMLKRILIFSGGPMLLFFLLFPMFYYFKKVQNVDIPVWAVYLVQTGVFGGGLLGISYGIISASWDPKREGSLGGWNEFQANLPLVLDRFRRKT